MVPGHTKKTVSNSPSPSLEQAAFPKFFEEEPANENECSPDQSLDDLTAMDIVCDMLKIGIESRSLKITLETSSKSACFVFGVPHSPPLYFSKALLPDVLNYLDKIGRVSSQRNQVNDIPEGYLHTQFDNRRYCYRVQIYNKSGAQQCILFPEREIRKRSCIPVTATNVWTLPPKLM